MELELNRSRLIGYETVLDTTACQEETLETIVPDACPDILRLIDTQGKVFLKSKTASDGRVMLSGTARLTVLYLPEDGTGPCRLEVQIPLQMSVDGKGVKSDCFVAAVPRIIGADTRTVNPRKVITRVEVAVQVKAYCTGVQNLCTGAAEGTEVEQLLREHRFMCIPSLQEKQITFEDNLSIPAGRPGAEEILHSRVEIACRESKIIGSKLIFKGDAAVRLLYRPHGGGLDAADFTLPFSQITEVSGVGENGVAAVELALTGCDFVLGEDGRTVSATLSILACALVREERCVKLLEDIYSTCCEMDVRRVPWEYKVCRFEGTGRTTVQEVIESGLQVRSVVDTRCLVGRLSRTREGGALRLSARLDVVSVCVTESSEYCAISREFDVFCMVDAQEECTCEFNCRCGEVLATPTADGVEVRLPLEFPYVLLKDVQATVVSEARMEEQGGEDGCQKPSIVLRVVGSGESLWDVAKSYSTTVGDILTANELESEQISGGTLLLIPRKR